MKKVLLIISIFTALNLLHADSLREKLGEDNSFLYTKGELRIGYIKVDNKNDIDTKGFGVGAHLHFDTKDYYGFSAGASFYVVGDFGLNPSNKNEINEDFFGPQKDGSTFVSEAYLKYIYKKTEFKVGRMVIDTPHADSDDIRMIPNFFEGYLIENSSFENIIFTLAHLNKMAGWENGVDAKKFVSFYKVMGIEKKTDGVSLASINYEKDNINASIWAYKILDVTKIIYFEGGYSFNLKGIDLNLALQFDRAKDSGDSLMESIDTKTFGAMIEASIRDFTFNAAYNKEYGDTGSMFSFGGGVFFTSMEDQTIDAVEDKDAKSYTFGIEYNLEDRYTFGMMYGKFEAGDKNVYETDEFDAYMSANLTAGIEAELVYAKIDDKTEIDGDFDIFRIILKRSF